MRKNYLIFSLLTLIGIMLTSCIKEEALNSEADIESIEVDKNFLLMSPIIGNQNITLRVSKNLDLKTQAPIFTLTDGAKIDPPSGTIRDFSNGPLFYKVTSQSGSWSKNYSVEFITSDLSTNYSFEDFREEKGGFTQEDRFHVVEQINDEGKKDFDWASGNGGFALTSGDKKTPSDFPTSIIDEGFIGKGLKLETLSTGALGAMFGSPIAAGNLFIGEFDITNALVAPLKATKFGMPFKYEPSVFRGFFKYKSGKTFKTKEQKVLEGKKDTWDAYAILFEASVEDFLDGSHDFKDEKIVSIARLPKEERVEANEWTLFEVPFTYLEGKKYDPNKTYKLAIVFSASEEGSAFNGAVGSTLYIDEVEIIKL